MEKVDLLVNNNKSPETLKYPPPGGGNKFAYNLVPLLQLNNDKASVNDVNCTVHHVAVTSPTPDSPYSESGGRKYKGPLALIDPNDPYGMRWTVNNGSAVVDLGDAKRSAPNYQKQQSQQSQQLPEHDQQFDECSLQNSVSSDSSSKKAKTESLHTANEAPHEVAFKPVEFIRSRLSFKKMSLNRLVEKNGECNVSMSNIPMQKSKYFADIFTTVVDMKWRWCLLLFAISFLSGWFFFALIYYAMMVVHDDFAHLNETDWVPCVQSTKNFLSVFMFSLETQHTIGYGSRYPTDQCPPLVMAISLQSIIGIMIQTLLTGVVFAKLARPKKRAATLIFSKNCCICMRDGKLCMLFRVGDMRKSHLAEAHIRMQMISKRMTNEGELLPFHQFDMNVGYDAGLDRIFVVWPITICHVIDENSPMYGYSADDLATARFEIISILEGVVPSTGSTTQARTSYLPSEILWGHRFERLVTYQRDNGEYKIDFSKFDITNEVDTPTLSAKEIDVMTEAGLNFREVYQSTEVEQLPSEENSVASPSELLRLPANTHKPSIADILSRRNTSVDETTNLLPSAPAPPDREAFSDGTINELPFKRIRKMSTLSNRLDKWVPAILTRTASNKSLTTIRSTDSGGSGSATHKEKVTTVLREHDIM